mmetsp:Transcript_43521/g.70631  ORF Transcript_43521/g.70631 Transcript_43521/m.70631 type:complete len:86 (-) Transcript_43521:161-418(-)
MPLTDVNVQRELVQYSRTLLAGQRSYHQRRSANFLKISSYSADTFLNTLRRPPLFSHLDNGSQFQNDTSSSPKGEHIKRSTQSSL